MVEPPHDMQSNSRFWGLKVETDERWSVQRIGGTWMGFLEKLREAEVEARAQDADPWRQPLQRLGGNIGDDGVERIATQAVFDFLELPQRRRGAGSCRRLARLMRELGWRPIKARGLNQRGLLDQIRGYARDHNRSPLS